MPLDARQPLSGRGHQRVDVAELVGEEVGDAVTDVVDREPGQQAGQAAVFARRDAVDEILGRLFAHPLQFDELVQREAIQVRDGADETGVDELLDDLLAQPLDVHGAAARKGAEHLLGLGRTLAATGAAIEDAVTDHRAAARGTCRRKLKDLFAAGARLGLGAHHIGNDLAGLLDDDRVADADVLGLDKVGVVKTGPLHGAGELHRLQVRDRASAFRPCRRAPRCCTSLVSPCSAGNLYAITRAAATWRSRRASGADRDRRS